MEMYVYPAIFHPDGDGYEVWFPDLSGCITEGYTLADALDMAQDALALWTGCQLDYGNALPLASNMRDIDTEGDDFVNLIWAAPNRANQEQAAL